MLGISEYGIGDAGWSRYRCGRTSDCVPCVISSDVTRASYSSGQVPCTVTVATRSVSPGAPARIVSVVAGTGRPVAGPVTTRLTTSAPAPWGNVT